MSQCWLTDYNNDLTGARFHDFHHYNFNGNYSSSFVWWDWLFGTDKQYREFVKQNKSKKE